MHHIAFGMVDKNAVDRAAGILQSKGVELLNRLDIWMKQVPVMACGLLIRKTA